MNELCTISQISRQFGVSTRMLRYYEREGLLSSSRQEGYAYRMYDEEAVTRLRQIVILRKLRIPLKEIKAILEDAGAVAAIEVFEKNVGQLDEEMAALGTLRGILADLLDTLKSRAYLPAKTALLNDDNLLELADTLSLSKTKLSEERVKQMEELERTEQAISKPRDVRIVHLPASTVAAAHYVGDDPEDVVGKMMADFVRSNRLWEKNPDLRLYGFNHPNPVDETNFHGYEVWVTIPEDMEVPEPLMKKKFEGGTYAAHMIQMGNFHEWAWLDRWVRENQEYVYNGSGTPENMFGSLEEHLNYFDHIRETPLGEPKTFQLDLMIPVRKKTAGNDLGEEIPGGTF